MSLIKGRGWYVWEGDHHMHIWQWKPEEDVTEYVQSCYYLSGVAVPLPIFEEVVVQALERMRRDGTLDAAQKRVWGETQSGTA